MTSALNPELPLSELFEAAQSAQYNYETVGAVAVAEYLAQIPAQRSGSYENNIDYVRAEAHRDLTAAVLEVAIQSKFL